MEIEHQILVLPRRLEKLQHQMKSEVSLKKPSVTKGVFPKV